MTIDEKINEIIDNFSLLSDWEERFKYVMDLGRDLPPLPSEQRTDDYKLNGCQSQVWLHAEMTNGRLYFLADSDSMLVKGLVALLIRVYSDETPQTILNTPPAFLEKLGMQQHLTPNRANGLAAMIKQIRVYALGYQQKLGQN